MLEGLWVVDEERVDVEYFHGRSLSFGWTLGRGADFFTAKFTVAKLA